VSNQINILGFDVGKVLTWLDEAPPSVLCLVGVLVIGFGMRKAEWIPNNRIPMVLMLVVGPALYIMASYGIARFYVVGVSISGIVWLCAPLIWKKLSKRFGLRAEPFDQSPSDES